jgi:hypothetical protein
MHQCPDKQLKVMVLNEDDGDGQLLAVEVSEEEVAVDGELEVMTLKGLGCGERRKIPNGQTPSYNTTLHCIALILDDLSLSLKYHSFFILDDLSLSLKRYSYKNPFIALILHYLQASTP